MAKVIRTEERDGHTIAVYVSGAEYDMTDKRLVAPASHTVITPERATLLYRRKQEKTARLLRERIRRIHSEGGKMTAVTSSAEAFAESGALLYDEIVLSPDAYPRDRLETWEKLGRYAQVLADPRDKPEPGGAAGAAVGVAVGVAAAIERVMRDIMAAQARAEAIDAEVE